MLTLTTLIDAIVHAVSTLGYTGIIIMMFLESSFFPFPSEVVMIPAGYLAAQSQMNLFFVLLSGLLGSLLGSLFNYYLAKFLGRKAIVRYGKYVMMNEAKLLIMERFFQKHGAISTFIGRLLPGVRQYISLPAGLGKMPLGKFIFFTILGAGIWVSILTMLGYFLGHNQALVDKYLHNIVIMIFVGIILLSTYYVKRKSKI